MKAAMLLAALCAACAMPSAARDGQGLKLPHEVEIFVARRDGCDHFRGEPAYDATRAAELDAKLAELCTGTDAELARLKRVHARNQVVARVLARYDVRVE